MECLAAVHDGDAWKKWLLPKVEMARRPASPKRALVWGLFFLSFFTFFLSFPFFFLGFSTLHVTTVKCSMEQHKENTA